MPDSHRLLLFLAAALILAATPGPGIFYVLARTLAGGRVEGFQSSFGTFFGGLFHVFAAALGVSAILAASLFVGFTLMDSGQYQETNIWVVGKPPPAPYGPRHLNAE